ncbi:hypothetical protein GGS21DRAFT_45107 [Xylaria nigripes]|nr:hypothetical protein GGS21DRAFT_45107 [Xylaria nigripes]
MPPKRRSQTTPSANVTYRSTAATPEQQVFSHRRRSVKTYGRPKSSRKLKQETLTQMNFTSSGVHEVVDVDDDGDVEKPVQEDVDSEPTKPANQAKPTAKSHRSRRRTTGDVSDLEEMPRDSKRRKTLSNSPIPKASSNFHTQTLTQMVPDIKDEDTWQVKDSQDDEEKLILETPRKSTGYHGKKEPTDFIMSTVPSLITSVTPANRQKKVQIPSSQSPATPMLLRYGSAPEDSPLAAKPTSNAILSSILKNPCKTPRNAIIPDSYSTAHDSPAPNNKSTVKCTPLKKLCFELPSDKENITPGRQKPKSPKPKTQSTGRRPLQEVPDSDEDFDGDVDETEYETSEDEREGGYDPESPTTQRFRSAIPPAKTKELETGPPNTADCPLAAERESVLLKERQRPVHDLESSNDIPSVPQPGPAVSLGPRLLEQDCHPRSPMVIYDESSEMAGSKALGLESSMNAEIETPRPRRTRQDMANSGLASEVEQYMNPASSEQAESNHMVVASSPPLPGFSSPYHHGLESQRIPLDSIHALGPQTPHSDIMVSLHPEHIAKIVDRTKTHEFRAWKIPPQVSRIWIYITRPQCQLKYMCLFGEPKAPGEIRDEKGAGNVDFNQGKSVAKFAYEILQVYELNNPVSLVEMKKKGWVSGAPQKYTFIPPAVVGELTANLRCALFENAAQPENSCRKYISESQELKAQLQSELGYSTQHHSGTTDEVIPASQPPCKSRVTSEGVSGDGGFAKPALTRARSTSSNHGSPSLFSQRQRSSVRPSQATTVSQMSSSPVTSPKKSGSRTILISSDPVSSPTVMRHVRSSLQSPQFPTRSQMLPDSLLNKDFHDPPTIIWDSADDHSDC